MLKTILCDALYVLHIISWTICNESIFNLLELLNQQHITYMYV